MPQGAVAPLAAVLGKYKAYNADPRDAMLLVTALIQVFQKLFGHSGGRSQEVRTALTAAIDNAATLDWSRVNFPISATLLSQTYADIFTENNISDAEKYSVLIESLTVFLDILQANPEYATEPVLRRIVADTVVAQLKPVVAPELNYRANVLKIFKPATAASVDLEPLAVVVYRGELIGGGFGPELWGLAYTKDDKAHVLLETGEYVVVPAVSLVLAVTKDYDTSELPPYLLACAKLFMPIMLAELANGETAEMQMTIDRLSGHFGAFLIPPALEAIPLQTVAACDNVLEAARWGATTEETKNGAISLVDIPQTQLRVLITAQQSAIRPYITSTLVRTDNNAILMRLDVPREFSARGIYLFPRGDQSVALIVV